MRFSRSIWSLFAESPQGNEVLATCSQILTGDAALAEWPEGILEDAQFVAKAYGAPASSLEDAEGRYERLLTKGVKIPAGDGAVGLLGGNELELWTGAVEVISAGLAIANPECFFPYGFLHRFNFLVSIFREFEIGLLSIPGKLDWEARSRYYLALNRSLQEFRRLHGMTPEELCAFLYGFALPLVIEEEQELPAPGRAWFWMGGAGGPEDFASLDGAGPDSTEFWQGNLDTRRGDVGIMWCVSPRSYVHSIWRADTDGFVDPFFHYHSTIWIRDPVRTPQVTFRELDADPVWHEKPATRAHFQGASGKPVTAKEYEALLALLQRRGMDTSVLPRLSAIPLAVRDELANERDVEVHLVEPLLGRLGFHEKDWVRQMPVRMGRGERVYSDYALGAVARRGEESARVLVEAKFRLDSERLVDEAYLQAQSYALRLHARAFFLASREGVWLFEADARGLFARRKALHKTWVELEDGEHLRVVEAAIGRKGRAWT